MSLPFSLPENCKLVMMDAPVAANALACDYICTKNAHKVWFVIQHYGGGGDTDLVLSLTEAQEVAGSNTTAVTATVPIWSDIDAGTSSDGLAKQTDAASYTIDTGAGADYLTVIEWDPAKHSDGYDCITVSDSGGNASNIVSVLAVIWERYQQATPPSAIID